MFPNIGASWIDVGGTWAMFDGVDSPITQSFGLGMFEPATEDSMAELESFFRDRGSPPFHEVSPLAGKDLLLLLSSRGYEPFELTSVMFLPLPDRAPSKHTTTANLKVRIANHQDAEMWVDTSIRGWSEYAEYAAVMRDLARVGFARQGAVSMLVECNGNPIATASMAIHEGVALMAGASTVPEARGQGAQRALLNARLEHALQSGCELAMMCAEPGSASQRNAERVGFRIAYTRIKWRFR